MAFESNLAGVARVAFEAQTGEFNRDVAVAEAKYRSATSGMSDAALKLELAQNRLQRQVARGPANYQALARAELQVRRAEAELQAESRRSTATLRQEERAIGRLARGAVAGSGALHGLGRSAAYASTLFLGGAGLVHAVRESIKAAADHQVVYGQLAVAVKDAGLNYDAEREAIERSIKARERLGFTEEESVRSYLTLIRATKDSAQATRLQAAAADIARSRNVPLEQATNAVAKAWAGQSTALKRLLPGLDQTKKGYALIEDAQKRTAGAAEAYGKTVAGAQARLNVAIHETEVSIGTALLPTVANIANKFADWASKEENQKRIQKDVNEAVHVGAGVTHELSSALHLVLDVAKPVVDGLGGIEKTAKILIALKFASIVRGWAGSMGLLQTRAATSFAGLAGSAAAATARVEADAAAMDAALSKATRPRQILITESFIPGPGGPGRFGAAAAGAAGAAGAYAAGRGGSSLVRRISRYGIKGVTGSAADLTVGGGALAGLILYGGLVFGESGEQGSVAVSWSQKEDQYYAISVLGSGPYPKFKISIAEARKIDNAFVERIEAFKRAQKRARIAPPAAGPSGHHGDSGLAPTPRPDRAAQIQLQLDRTEGTTGPARVSALNARISYDNKYIAIQERLLKTDAAHYKEHAAILGRLYGERKAARAELDQIATDAARKDKQAADKSQGEYAQGVAETEARLADAIKRARTPAGKQRAQDARTEFLKREINDAKLTRAQRDRYRAVLRAEQAAERKDAAAELTQTRSATEARIKNAVARAEVALEQATKGSAAYTKALAALKKAKQDEINYYAALARIDKGRQRQADIAKELAAKKALAKLGKSSGGSGSGGMSASDWRDFYLQTLNTFVGSFAPNVFRQGANGTRAPGSTPTVVEQHFYFPTAPTPGLFRELVHAKDTARAVFD